MGTRVTVSVVVGGHVYITMYDPADREEAVASLVRLGANYHLPWKAVAMTRSVIAASGDPPLKAVAKSPDPCPNRS